MSETKTKWESIVSDEALTRVRTLRSKTFIESKQRRVALPELIEEGWEEYKSYKNNKFVGVRKNKRCDEIFEDRVWCLFAKLGFTHMNKDRYFEMSYDYHNPDITQQIDVFAADDETVIIVECKAAETIKDGVFKKPLEAFYGQMEGLRREAQKRFPKTKVKFIWATHNFIISPSDRAKMREWDIVHFSDAVINYYYELVKHLGTCARYQLLGNLFANQEIRNMDDKIPAIQGEMGGHKYYSFSIEPERLLKIGYVLHRNEANKNMMPTYQRLIKKKRLSDVQKFINNGGYFPNSLIISIDSGGKGLQFDMSKTKVEGAHSRLGVLHLPKRYRSAYIIDGQHRLYGYSDSDYATTDSIPVVAFVDLDRQEQIKLFMDINENQKAVPKTLRVTLNADMLWDSLDYNERRQALRSKIAQMFGEEETSPLMGRVVIGEDETSFIKCITVSAIQTALKKCNFMTQFGKKNIIVKDGTFDVGTNQGTCDLLYPFLEACLRYVKNATVEEWERGDSNDGMLTMNRGIQAVIRVINDIVNHLVDRKEFFPKMQKTEELVNQVAFYLDPLNEYINNLTQQERKDLRGYFGGRADNRFWRAFQREIAKERSDFAPDGLSEYWENEAKTYNADSMTYLREIEAWIKQTIQTTLMDKYGENWEIKALPKPIYKRAKSVADERNYDSIASGDGTNTISIWDCITLKECKKVVIVGSHWTELFEPLLTRPEEKKMKGGKVARTKWIEQVESLQNKLNMPFYSITTAEFEFIKSVHIWLKA
ncbi:MAG: DGQHR domain-containing protein [Lachnospiraceae bacterium]